MNVGDGEELEKPQIELKELNYENAEESAEEEDTDGEKDDEGLVDQMETTNFVRYFYENDDDTGKRIGSGLNNLCVCAEGHNHYAPVGPTDTTGNPVVCGAAVLVAADLDQFVEEPIFIVTRGHVPEMKRARTSSSCMSSCRRWTTPTTAARPRLSPDCFLMSVDKLLRHVEIC